VVARIGVPEADVSTSDIGMNQIVAFLTREGLTEEGNDGRVLPRLAEEWTSAENGLTWRFHLQDAISFHDGSPATADDVVRSLRSAVTSRGRRGFLPGLADILSVDAVGPSDVEIKLRRRSNFLLSDLEAPVTRTTADKSVIGTGPFKVSSESRSEVILDAHETHYKGRPGVARVVIRAYPTLRAAWASLMRDEIDVLWDLSREAVEFAGTRDVTLFTYPRRYVHLIAFNSSRPPFRSSPVRRALNAALDRDLMVRDLLRGQGVAASGPVWPHHWAYDSSVPGYRHDPSLAIATLDAAGLKPVRQPSGRTARLAFTCIFPGNRPLWERLALYVQRQLYDIGVDMQLQSVPAEEYDRRILASDFDAVMIDMLSGPTLARPYAFWRWGGEQTALNVFGYRSAAADRWFDAVRFAPTDAEYRVAVAQLQRTLTEDPPALFLAWSERTRAVSRRFSVPVPTTEDPIPALPRWTVNRAAGATH
jgi:peptide/nickel transport system substrate-binding protein